MKIIVNTNKSIIRKIKDFIWIILGIFISIKNCWKLFSTKNIKRTRKIYNVEKIKLIDTRLLQNSINKGKYIDRYYNGLLDFLNDNERNKIFFVPHILGKFNSNDLDKIYFSSNENIIFKNDFLKISDYFFALNSILKLGNISTNFIKFRKFNILPIINEELSINKYSVLIPLLNFRFFRRLKYSQIDLCLVVNWFENQPLDKGFNLGVKTYYPTVNHIGYKGYIGENDYNIYNNPTQFEVSNKLIPNVLGVTGIGCVNISKKYYNRQNVKVFPSYRHQYLWKFNNYNYKMNKEVLVLFPLATFEARNILNMMLKFQNDKNIKVTFYIKPHPALDFDKIKRDVSTPWPNNFIEISYDLSKIINNVNLVIGTGTSACMESIALGIPTIIIGSRSNLTQCPIPNSVNTKIWKLIYSTDDLLKYISYYLNLDKIKLQKFFFIGLKVKEEFFVEPSREKSKLFLNL